MEVGGPVPVTYVPFEYSDYILTVSAAQSSTGDLEAGVAAT